MNILLQETQESLFMPDPNRTGLQVLDLMKLSDMEPPKSDSAGECRYINGYREYNIVAPRVPLPAWVPSTTTLNGALPNPQLEEWLRVTPQEQVARVQSFTQKIGELIHFQTIQGFIEQYPEYGMTQDIPAFVHKIAKMELLKTFRPYLVLAAELVANAKRFFAMLNIRIEIIDVETLCYNLDVGYAGRFDLLFLLKEGNGDWRIYIGDIKTSKDKYDNVKTQLSAYKHALLWMHQNLCLPDYIYERIRPFGFERIHFTIHGLYEYRIHTGTTSDKIEIDWLSIKEDWPNFLRARDLFYQKHGKK